VIRHHKDKNELPGNKPREHFLSVVDIIFNTRATQTSHPGGAARSNHIPGQSLGRYISAPEIRRSVPLEQPIQHSGIITDVQVRRGTEYEFEVIKGMEAVLLGGFDDGIEYGAGLRAVDGV